MSSRPTSKGGSNEYSRPMKARLSDIAHPSTDCADGTPAGSFSNGSRRHPLKRGVPAKRVTDQRQGDEPRPTRKPGRDRPLSGLAVLRVVVAVGAVLLQVQA